MSGAQYKLWFACRIYTNHLLFRFRFIEYWWKWRTDITIYCKINVESDEYRMCACARYACVLVCVFTYFCLCMFANATFLRSHKENLLIIIFMIVDEQQQQQLAVINAVFIFIYIWTRAHTHTHSSSTQAGNLELCVPFVMITSHTCKVQLASERVSQCLCAWPYAWLYRRFMIKLLFVIRRVHIGVLDKIYFSIPFSFRLRLLCVCQVSSHWL